MRNDSDRLSAGADDAASLAPATRELSLNVLIFALQSDSARIVPLDDGARGPQTRRQRERTLALGRKASAGTVEPAPSAISAVDGDRVFPRYRGSPAGSVQSPSIAPPCGLLGSRIDTTA